MRHGEDSVGVEIFRSCRSRTEVHQDTVEDAKGCKAGITVSQLGLKGGDGRENLILSKGVTPDADKVSISSQHQSELRLT